MNAYKKIEYTNGNSEWGTYIDLGYGRSKKPEPVMGSQIQIKTKAGEIHIRLIKKIVKSYASGCLVSLVADEQVTKNANARFEAAKDSSSTKKPSPVKPSGTSSHQFGYCTKCGSYCYGDCEAN